MLQLSKHQAEIDSVNLRAENHGKDRVLAVDVKCSFTGSNRLLDGIDPNLRESLFRAAERGDQGDFVDDQTAKENGVEDGLVCVKFPYADPTTIATKFEAYDVNIRGQLKRSKQADLVAAVIKNISLKPIDGGCVKIVLTASASKLEPKDVAVVSELFRLGKIRLSLTPPDVQHLDGDEDDGEDDDGSDDEAGDEASSDEGGDLLDQQERQEARARAA